MAERVVAHLSEVDRVLKEREIGWLLVAVVAYRQMTVYPPGGAEDLRELYFERDPQRFDRQR